MLIWAKSKPWETLEDHLSGVQTNALSLLSSARLQAFARLGISPERACELVGAAAWLHDWGKATQEWQDDINAGKPKLPQHSLTSFLACRWAINCKIEKFSPELLAMSLAVLAHHGQMHRGSFDAEAFRGNVASPHVDLWRELARSLPFSVSPATINNPFSTETICAWVKQSKSLVYDLTHKSDSKFRGLFCLLLTILVEADHSASGKHNPYMPVLKHPREPGTITDFQNEVYLHLAEMLCAMAGCGAGKTLAALLRGTRLTQEYGVDRIVLCLPTRFTANSLLRDMYNPKKYAYREADVGLVHSEALMVLRESFDKDDERDFPGTPEEHFGRSVRYEHPITISTVDHLLMSLYHGYRFADRAFGNLLTSLVVFDEIHAYDPVTLSAIRDGIKVLSRYGVPVLVMSATLPSSRRRFIGATEATTVVERANEFEPFVTRKLPEPLTIGRGIATVASPRAKRILAERTDLKLAIYVNQVERAKALARAASEVWSEGSIYCYHSELAPHDRRNLENKIIEAFGENKPVCLIATQAAELSLDISAECMVTELASADILVQRAGRLNRRGRSHLAFNNSRLPDGFEFTLFIAPVWQDEDDEAERAGRALPYKDLEVLERTWENTPWDEVFDFERGIGWCEIALPDEPTSHDGNLIKASNFDAAFGNKPQENFSGDNTGGVTIRDIDDVTLPVVPESLYLSHLKMDDSGEDTTKTIEEIAQLQVPVRRLKYFALQRMGVMYSTNVSVVLGKGTRYEKPPIDYTFWVMKNVVPYHPHKGGFDFIKLIDKSIAHGEIGVMS